MNDEFPTDPRQALESSLTALLLGELTQEEERFLRHAIDSDPELAKRFEVLNKTIALVRETEAAPRGDRGARLSAERRAKLLQHFKTVRPEVSSEAARRQPTWLLPVAAAGVLLLVVSALFQLRSRNKASAYWSAAAPRELVELKNTNVRAPELRVAVEKRVLPQPTLSPHLVERLTASGSEKRDTDELRSTLMIRNKSEDFLANNDRSAGDNGALVERAKRNPADEGKTTLPPNNIVLPSLQPSDTLFTLSNPPSSDSKGSLTFTANAGDTQTWAFYASPPSAPLGTSLATSSIFDRPFGLDSEHASLADAGGRQNDVSQILSAGGVVNTAAGAKLSVELTTNAIVAGRSTSAAATDFYSAGSFGGYSTVAPVPADRSFTFQRLGEMPALNEEAAPDSRKTPGGPPQPPLVAVQGGTAAKAVGEAPKEFALEEPKQEIATKLTLARGDTLADTFNKKVASQTKDKESRLGALAGIQETDQVPAKPAASPLIPQREVPTRANPFSTFSLNVSDVSFKLAAASLEKGLMPDAGSIRSEEFINAFDYRDPEPVSGAPVGFAFERARYPFSQNRDLLRFSIKTAAAGREAGRPLNLVLLLDNSGSMERADRVQIIREALRVLASQLKEQDTLSVVTFARTARLWVDGVSGDQGGRIADELGALTPEGGTNLEEAMNLAYQTALRHYLANGINRVVLLTDGAANLGNTKPEVLKQKVETNRKQGIALDCFGIGWEGYNDDLLEQLTRNGDGRYGFLNTPAEAATGFAAQLAGALQVAASDVKVQVEFNPDRVTSYRQVGYAKHQLTKEQFRDNSVDAAEIGAAESGNALYVVEPNPQGNGPLATVRVRYKVPGTGEYKEHEWTIPFTGNAVALEQAGPAMRLAATASAFSEWLAGSPYAAEVAPDRLLTYLAGVSDAYGADPRPQKLEWMIRQAKAISGK